jgi:DNA-binding PadR family transcriptional regulator
MSIKYAVLALIIEKPQHGYAVRNAFETRLSDVREIGYGQVYQVLAGLEKDGLVRGVSTSGGVRRIVYTATRRGSTALRAWLLGSGLTPRGFQDDVFLRLLFPTPDHIEGMIRFVTGQTLQVKEDLEILRAQRSELFPNLDPVARMRGVYIDAEVLHREADLAALGLALQEIDSLWPQAGRRRVRSAKGEPARASVALSRDQDLRRRSRLAMSAAHRLKPRFG